MTDGPEISLERKITRGAMWMVTLRFVERSLGLLSTLILVRLLLPEDFGLLAMAMTVIAFAELTGAFSLDVPLIQKKAPSQDEYDTAWTLKVIFAAVSAAIVAGLAIPASAFYEEPRLAPVMFTLAAAWLVGGLESIAVVNFRRMMDFRRETTFLLSKKLAGFCVTVTLAITMHSYWALVAGVVTSRLVGVVMSYVLLPHRPRLSLKASGALFSVSSWLFVNNLLHFGASRLSHLVIGRIHGPAPLGQYTLASELAYLPQTELVAPINRALFPGYSRLQEESGLRDGFLRTNAIIAALAFPSSVGIAVVAEPLVAILLGPNWKGAVPLLQVLAIAGGLSALMSNTYSAYLALGRAAVLTWTLLAELAALGIGLGFLARQHGVLGVAYAELFAVAVGSLCSLPVLFRTLNVSVLSYVRYIWRPAVASMAMAAAVHWLGDHGLRAAASLPALGALIGAGAATYLTTLFGLWFASGRPSGAEQTLGTELRRRIDQSLPNLAAKAK